MTVLLFSGERSDITDVIDILNESLQEREVKAKRLIFRTQE